MLDAMESNAKGNDNFTIKAISTENVEGKSSILKKNIEEVTRKNQAYFFSKLLPWATGLKVTSLENYSIFKILTCNIQRMIFLNKGSSSSRAIYKSINIIRMYDMDKASHAHLNAKLYT